MELNLTKWNGVNELVNIFESKVIYFAEYVILEVNSMKEGAVKHISEHESGVLRLSDDYGIIVNTNDYSSKIDPTGAIINLVNRDDYSILYMARSTSGATSVSFRLIKAIEKFNETYAYDVVLEEVVRCV